MCNIAIVSHYNGGTKNADGSHYGGHRIAGRYDLPFGTTIILEYKGKKFKAIIADRSARRYSSRFDLPSRSFTEFTGRREGIVRCNWYVLRYGSKHNSHKGSSKR